MSVPRARGWRPAGAARLGALVLAAGVCLLPLRAAASDAVELEYKVKTGYLFNFANFIEWPPAALPEPNSPFIVGVLDGGEALPVLQSLLKGKSVNGHPVQVRAVSADRIGRDVHILFVTRAAGKSPAEIQAALGGAATLLVGETERFAERGGMVGFVREEDNIRFQLNLERVAEAGLRASAKLASVARLVTTQTRELREPRQ